MIKGVKREENMKKFLSMLLVLCLAISMINVRNVKAASVNDSLKIEKFEVENSEVKCGEKVKLNVQVSGRMMGGYTIYEEDANGIKKVIMENNLTPSFIWKPTEAGKKTLYLEVKSSEGKIIKASTEVTVKKGTIPEIDDEIQYCYITGEPDAGIDIVKYIMQYNIPDARDESFNVYVEELGKNKVITLKNDKLDLGCLYFSVTDHGEIGDSAVIHFVMKSRNYEDIKINVKVTLKDQEEIIPHAENLPQVEGNSNLTYGEKLGKLKLNTDSAVFITKNGSYVNGILKFENDDEILPVGTSKANYVFIPNDKKYKEYHGTVNIKVEKASLTLENFSTNTVAYASEKTLNDVKLKNGKAVAIYNGKEKEISGNWQWKNPDEKLKEGCNEYTMAFIPDDLQNYGIVEQKITVKAKKGAIAVKPKDSEIGILGEVNYGQSISGLVLNKEIEFLDEDGQKVEGIIQCENANNILEVGENEIKYSFKPKDKDYECYKGTAKIKVQKVTPQVEDVKDIKLVCSQPVMKYKDVEFEKPIVKVMFRNEKKVIKGQWNWEKPDELLKVGKTEATIVFTPEDKKHYNSVETKILVDVRSQNLQKSNTTEKDKELYIKTNDKLRIKGIIYKVTKIENAKNAQVTITSLDKKKSSIVIPDYITINGVKCKVITIKKKALYKRTKLKKLTIGKNVQTIEDNAFNGCKNLKSITIKSTVLKKVGKNAIKGIHKKAVIKVPKKQYKKYKKLFGKKSGFKKPMKLKK